MRRHALPEQQTSGNEAAKRRLEFRFGLSRYSNQQST
jgi:hypothetical protein